MIKQNWTFQEKALCRERSYIVTANFLTNGLLLKRPILFYHFGWRKNLYLSCTQDNDELSLSKSYKQTSQSLNLLKLTDNFSIRLFISAKVFQKTIIYMSMSTEER